MESENTKITSLLETTQLILLKLSSMIETSLHFDTMIFLFQLVIFLTKIFLDVRNVFLLGHVVTYL